VDDDAIRKKLKQMSKFEEVEILVHRVNGSWSNMRRVEIEVWDLGPEAGANRYTATALVPDHDGSEGREIVGNASRTVDDALDAIIVHLAHYVPE
jgi:hypothetical protein